MLPISLGCHSISKRTRKRLGKFSLSLEPNKTRLVEFGRFAARHAKRRAIKLESIYFLGFTHFCNRNRKGNFMVSRKTENKRFRCSFENLKELMRNIRHQAAGEQVKKINQVLQGHYDYYGIAGNIKSLRRIYRLVEWYWHKMLSRRSQDGYAQWDKFYRIRSQYPLQTPKLHIPWECLQSYAVL